MSDAIEPEEPTDEDMAEVLGVDLSPSIPLPYGSHPTADVAQTVLRVANGAPEVHQVAPDSDKATAQVGLDKGDRSAASPETPRIAARDQNGAPTIAEAIEALPRGWLRVYAAALYETGDPAAARKIVAAKSGRVSVSSIEEAAKEFPAFGKLIEDHAKEQHENVFSAIYRGATEGDLAPFNTREGTEWYRKRSDKAGEVWLKAKGLMADQQVTVNHTGRVELVPDVGIGKAVENIIGLLFGGPAPAKQVEGKVVSESDKKEA